MLSVKLATCNYIIRQSIVRLIIRKEAVILRLNYSNHASCRGSAEFSARSYFLAVPLAVSLK